MFNKFGLRVVREIPYNQAISDLNEISISRYKETRNGFLFKFLDTVEDPTKTLRLIPESKSQLFQDLFVLEKLEWKIGGYFVEFGATNGIDLSNTYLLEKNFSWSGILAEPGKNWHNQLKANRNSHISTKCVWKSNGEKIIFNEAIYPEFSTIDALTSFDGMEKSRKSQDQYFVETITLLTLLDQAKAPNYIDYISVDTEGSEYEILAQFDFSKYRFGILTVEHNHNENEKKIDELLIKNGYSRVHREISDFDAWYISNNLMV